MAATEKQILETLRMIEMHTRNSAGNSAKMIADNQPSLGNENQSAFAKSNEGLIRTYKELQKAIKREVAAREEASKVAAAETVKNRKASKALDDLRANIEKQIGEGKKAATINKSVRKELDALGEMGQQLKTSFGLITDQNKNEYFNAIDDASDELRKLGDAARQVHQQELQNLKDRQKAHEENQKKFWNSFRTTMKATLGTMAVRLSQAAVDAQAMAFQFAPGAGTGQGIEGAFGTLGGMVDASVEAFAAGASIEEIQAFAAANREALTAATNSITGTQTAMLTAQEGLSAVEEYGDQLRNTFGFRGAAQLQVVGQSLTALTNLGIKPTMQNLKDYGQAVETLTKTSNMTANEIFAEFANLAEDSDFQAFFLAMGENVSATEYLSETFLNLQKTVGLNIKEFTEYQKFLARQRQRTGSERVVQAAFAAQLGEAMGLRREDIGLLQQGTAFRESLTAEEGARFDQLFNQLGVDVAARRGELARRGDVAGLQAIDILRQGAALPEQIGVVGRERAGVVGAQQAAQAERVEASKANTESIVELNATIREFLDGFAKSPLGGLSAGFFTGMTSAVFAGTLSGNLAAKGKGAALGAGKFLGKAGLVGAAGLAGYELGNFLGLDEVGRDFGEALWKQFGDTGLTEKQQRIRAMEDRLLERQVALGQEAQELNEQRDVAMKEGNQALVERLDAQISELRKQYAVMTEQGEERILQAREVGTHRRGNRGK